MRRLRASTIVAFVRAGLLATLLAGQTPGQDPPLSRTEEWQRLREEKSRTLEPEQVSKTEARLNRIQDARLIERVTGGVAGFRIRVGGLATGQGFAIGPEYFRPELAQGQLRLRASLRGATSRAYLADFELAAPKLAGGKGFVEFYSAHANYPRVDYYGPGPTSRRADRSNFRLEMTSVELRAGVTPLERLELGVIGGAIQANAGPGNRAGVAQTADLFTPDEVPGLQRQSDFLRGGVTAHYDYRDNPGGPRSGGSYSARFLTYADREDGGHSFRRLELEAQQYAPFFNKRRVIAVRVRSFLSFTRDQEAVPFYLQPTLGGSDDLRGFRPYRFYGDNSLVANVEYRWETFAGLDAALFFDAGKVTQRAAEINLRDLEASAGFGLRFNVRNNVFMRLDVGFSHEGTHIWLKFRNPF